MDYLLLNIIVGIITSIIGGVLLIGIASFLSQKARWVLTGTLGRLLNVDIDYVFSNKDEALSDLANELERTREIAIFTSRGNELQRATFASLFHKRPQNRDVYVRILLPETTIREGHYNWTQQRESELAKFDAAFGNGLLPEQIEVSVRFLQEYLSNGTVELRRFNYPHIGRILITDRFAYFTPYKTDAHGAESPIYKFRKGGDMYDNLSRLFDQLWEADT